MAALLLCYLASAFAPGLVSLSLLCLELF
jgi:hypothetical protein